LKHPNQEEDIYHLKTSCKEDEDFVILPKEAFEYLYGIYSGIRLPRFSIELRTDEDEEEEDESNKVQENDKMLKE
jgi:hypothetical protein